MNKIVCAVRGGKRSEPTIERAIELARESGAELIFLYVFDAEFLGYATMGRPSVTLTQMKNMAEFILLTIQDRARQAGVEADTAVREGKVREQICTFAAEQQADMVVMGKPAHLEGSDLFTYGEQVDFIRKLQERLGVDVVLV